MSRHALFLAHEADVAPGYVGDAAAARGFTVDTWAVWADPLPEPTAYDLIVPLGSAASAYDDTVPWLAGELDFLARAVAADVPVFGICFGAQALARTLGGHVRPAATPEVGWVTIDSDQPATIASGPWLEWHFDTLAPPPGATVLARSDAAVQAFRVGRTLGVQFHPEVSPAILASWIAGSRARLAAIGVDADALLDETRRRAPQAARNADLLLDRVLALLAV